MIFWKDKGDRLEMLKLPFDPSSSKPFTKVYESDEEIRYCRMTIINNREYLVLVDEAKHVKILQIEESSTQKYNKISVYKEYYVDNYFSTSVDVQQLKNYSFCNEMLYSNSGAYILQEKSKAIPDKFYALYYAQYSLDYSTTKFPMCTEDFILFSLTPEYDSTYTNSKQFLLLAPPMNSYSIRQREVEEDSHELFCHFDDKYIIYTKFSEASQEYSCKDRFLSLQVYLLNGEIVQTVDLPKFAYTCTPIFSPSGEYLVIPVVTYENYESRKDGKADGEEEIDLTMIVYKIKSSNDYKKSSLIDNGEEIQHQSSKLGTEVIEVEEIRRFVVHDDWNAEDDQYDFQWGDIQTNFIDNKGTVFYLNMNRYIFTINETNYWGKFKSMLDANKFVDDDIDIVKFGQGTIVLKHHEDILVAKYADDQIKSSKIIKHKALDIQDECDLENMVLPKNTRYLIIIYLLNEASTIIVWDTEKDIEHNNFLGRKDDELYDYLMGKNSKLGFM